MFCISVSFKKTPLEVRQQFAFSEKEQITFLSGLIKQKMITGGVIISTCNRSEIYFTGNKDQIEVIETVLAEQKQIDGECIKKYCLYYQGQKAVYHLYKVACGFDSMVLGEDEILHQVKESYLLASNSGFTNSELNIIFQGAFNCAKLSKSETSLSNTPVSIGTLTANVIEDYLDLQKAGKNRRKQADHGLLKVLVIGATGKIGSIVAKDLLAKRISVIGTSRKHHKEDGVYLHHSEYLEWLDFDRRYEVVSQVSVVVSATASPHYTLTREEFLRHTDNRDYLLIDLAVPYDIDKELAKAEGISLLDIDYFKTLSKENHDIKLGELEKAENILKECVEEVLKKLYFRDFQRKMAEKCEEPWFAKMTFYLRDVLDSEQLRKVLDRIYQQETER